MPQATLHSLSVSGLRCIDELTLRLDGLTVLVGDHGAGKSSIVEALELCRRLGDRDFLASIQPVHGGLASLLRRGALLLQLVIICDVTLPGAAPVQALYTLALAPRGQGFTSTESFKLLESGEPRVVFQRFGAEVEVWDGRSLVRRANDPTGPRRELLLTELGGPLAPHPAIDAVRDALAAIEVHLPFEVTPAWAARAHARPSAARGAVLLEPAERLSMFGSNLANAYFALRNEHDEAHWQTTLELVRLGLGANIESIHTRADPSGGSLALAVKRSDLAAQLPASALSDGELAYLCFVALHRLNPGRSLLAFDEPALHLPPALLVRVVHLLERLATRHPVVITTHSLALLETLSQPASAVRLCELQDGATRLRRLDAPALRAWMRRPHEGR